MPQGPSGLNHNSQFWSVCLPVSPLESIQPLSSHSLSASSSLGTDPQHLIYRVLHGPRLGRLLHAQQGSASEALINFTQAEVRAGLKPPC